MRPLLTGLVWARLSSKTICTSSDTLIPAEDLDGRVQPFDSVAASVAGTIAAERERNGRSVELRDVQIAGIAASRRATLATRNIRHFDGLGIDLVNPWG